jgi:hypothetical protein
MDAACVTFAIDSPSFTANIAGKYLVLWCSSTKHETVEIGVSSPTSAAVARNEAKWQRGFFIQAMSGSYSYPTGRIDPVLTRVDQTRPFMPFGHVSHSVLVDLEQDEVFAFAVTGNSEREWTLVAWRMPDHAEEQRRATVGSFISSSSSTTGATLTFITRGIRVALTNATAWTQTRFAISTGTNGTTYKARIRVYRDSTDLSPTGGVVTLNLLITNTGPTTTLASSTITIPNTGATSHFVEFAFDFTVASSGTSYLIDFEFVNADSSSKRFEAETLLEQTFP